MSNGRLETADRAIAFMMGGNATFTLVSEKTGNRFTYKVSEAKDNETLSFVALMNGPDNEASYQYLGTIREGRFSHGRKSRINQDAPSAKAFNWFFQNVTAGNRIPEALQVWHEGRCARCARKLTVPASIESGFGPECARQMECTEA